MQSKFRRYAPEEENMKKYSLMILAIMMIGLFSCTAWAATMESRNSPSAEKTEDFRNFAGVEGNAETSEFSETSEFLETSEFSEIPDASEEAEFGSKLKELVGNGTDKILEKTGLDDEPAAAGVRNVMENVVVGDFEEAKAAGSQMTSKAFVEKAARNSFVKKFAGAEVKPTGQLAARRAELALTEVANAGAQAAGACALINGGVATVEAITSGADVYEATGQIITEAAKGAISGTAGVLAGEAAIAGLAAVGVTGTAATVGPAAACAVVGGLTIAWLDQLAVKYDVPQKIADGTEIAVDATVKAANATKDATVKAANATKDATVKAAKATKNAAVKATIATKDAAVKAADATKDAFVNAAAGIKGAAESVADAAVNAAQSISGTANTAISK